MKKEKHTEVILVTKEDLAIGRMEKLEAHEKGLLHRAFSVLVFNYNGELLLQRRAFGKYHSEGLWTNTCCSHPSPGETNLKAANRRLQEEMGLECDLEEAFHFIYHTPLDNNLIEHELDHVLIGFSEETPHLNTDEAIAFKWMDLDSIQLDLQTHPQHYTFWFKLIIQDHLDQLKKQMNYESLQKRNI